jgi:S-adenosylmethionine-diacylglycerol 3-amino-3-carboxypropyl transferase
MKLKLQQWLSDKTFQFVHGRNLVYNTCWEDPALDRIALQLSPKDTVLVITSAGCNALDYLLAGAGRVHAVDMNYRQNALLEMKKAAIKSLDYGDFFQLFGRGKHPNIRKLYSDKLRQTLPRWSHQFWDRRFKFFAGKGWRSSFYFRGTAGTFARMINTYVDRVAKVRDDLNALFACDTVAEQDKVYHERLKPRFWKRFIKWAVRRDATLSLLGVPRPQRLQVERYYPGGIAKFIEDSMEAVFAKLPLKDNYFWRVYLTGEYTPECCPEYLKEENFHRLKSGLIDQVTTHTSTVTAFLKENDVSISRFVLLDHMDWLAFFKLPYLRDEWQAIVDRAAPETKIIYRSGGTEVDYVEPLEVDVRGKVKPMRELLRFQPELAKELHVKDRVHTYGSFYIADLVK